MKEYLDILRDVYENGWDADTRNAQTRKLFSPVFRFDLQRGFPAVSTKKLYFETVKAELLWFLSGANREGRADENVLRSFQGKSKNERTIWTDNIEQDWWQEQMLFEGDAGLNYNISWRNWPSAFDDIGIDQIAWVIENIKKNPQSRRHVVSNWNPDTIDKTALPPCHTQFIFNVMDGKLNLQMTQRSGDTAVGIPFNIAEYAALCHMIAQLTDLDVGELAIIIVDAHIYHKHFEKLEKQLSREPYDDFPELWLNPEIDDIDDFTMDDIKLKGYEGNHHPPIHYKMIP